MKRNLFPRLLITVIGVALIFWGISELLLGFAGEHASAVVTDIRREGGERTDMKPGRYTYNIGYTFTLPDGRQVYGTTKKIGGGAFIKADGAPVLSVRYFKAAPFINAPEEDATPSAAQPTLLLAGSLMLFAVNRKSQE